MFVTDYCLKHDYFELDKESRGRGGGGGEGGGPVKNLFLLILELYAACVR